MIKQDKTCKATNTRAHPSEGIDPGLPHTVLLGGAGTSESCTFTHSFHSHYHLTLRKLEALTSKVMQQTLCEY